MLVHTMCTHYILHTVPVIRIIHIHTYMCAHTTYMCTFIHTVHFLWCVPGTKYYGVHCVHTGMYYMTCTCRKERHFLHIHMCTNIFFYILTSIFNLYIFYTVVLRVCRITRRRYAHIISTKYIYMYQSTAVVHV
jgi:hypothetical protein